MLSTSVDLYKRFERVMELGRDAMEHNDFDALDIHLRQLREIKDEIVDYFLNEQRFLNEDAE